MDRELIEEFSSLAGLAIALNDLDKFRVHLDFSGHVNYFSLRIGNNPNDRYSATCFERLSKYGEKEYFHVVSLDSVKEAKSWLLETHKKHILEA